MCERCQALESERVRQAEEIRLQCAATKAYRDGSDRWKGKFERAEASLSALQADLAKIEPYLWHKADCAHAKWATGIEDHCGDPGCTCGLDTRLAGLRGIR